MDFEISDDRRMLADTLARFLSAQSGIEHRNRVAYTAPYHDPDTWAAMAELGILHALADETAGGFGGEGFDIATVFEALGRALCPEPVLPALLAVHLLTAAGAPLDQILSGEERVAVAIGEMDAPYHLADIATGASRDGTAWRLSGRKSVVYGLSSASRLLVAAGTPGGIGVFEVAPEAAALTPYGMIDGGGAGEVFLDATPATLVMEDAEAALRDAMDAAALALCAEAVGAMEVTQDTLLDYLKTRKQFGRAIGTFQVLQHRMVDLAIAIEQARSITILAASRMGTDAQTRTISMAKSLVGRTARLVAEETIQMHGGIAMTWEYPASHYAKRLVMIDHQFGDSDHHLQQVMATYQTP
ncbi:MAG: acyl-CoA dehydrogenase family protein [Pseudomonadota bacterium]